MTYRDDEQALRLRLQQLDDDRHEVVEKMRGLVPAQRLLDRARTASPCDARWDRMEGDDQKRFCRLCKKFVYDVSQLTTAQAEHLLQIQDEPCMRLFRRADGTVLTADCPPGRRAKRKRQAVATAAAGITATLIASAAWTTQTMGGVHVSPYPVRQIDNELTRDAIQPAAPADDATPAHPAAPCEVDAVDVEPVRRVTGESR